jgi:hypothetical protein
MFPPNIILNYIFRHPVANITVKQSFIWLLIHTYLNVKPRFEQSFPLVFAVPSRHEEDGGSKREQQFEMEREIIRRSNFPEETIADILACMEVGDSLTDRDLEELKSFIFGDIKHLLATSNDINEFYSSAIESYLVCLKFFVKLSVLKKEEIEEVKLIIKKISNKVDESLVIKADNNEKLESSNFRELLLEMVEKNVIKKFNQSVKYDGIEDEVEFNNICSVFVNYSFYQNILLEEKDQRKRRCADAVIKIVLKLIALYGEIERMSKIKAVIEDVTKESNISMANENKSSLIHKAIIQNGLSAKNDNSDIFKLLALIFYNSNTYEINEISINYLFQEIFSDRIAIEQFGKLQFNVNEEEIKDFNCCTKVYNNIKFLAEAA